jgi:hypothetical protein
VGGGVQERREEEDGWVERTNVLLAENVLKARPVGEPFQAYR